MVRSEANAVPASGLSLGAHPSSVPAAPGHLLPQGEKGGPTEGAARGPSPLAGEGARRADEGWAANQHVESGSRTKSFAKTLRHRQTDPESRLWRLLRGRRFMAFKFRRQVPIGPYIADFVCYSQRVIVELDGSQHADSATDVRRDKWLADDGYRVVRIWNNDLVFRRAAVCERILHVLENAAHPSSVPAASGHLLPQGEKGEGGLR